MKNFQQYLIEGGIKSVTFAKLIKNKFFVNTVWHQYKDDKKLPELEIMYRSENYIEHHEKIDLRGEEFMTWFKYTLEEEFEDLYYRFKDSIHKGNITLFRDTKIDMNNIKKSVMSDDWNFEKIQSYKSIYNSKDVVVIQVRETNVDWINTFKLNMNSEEDILKVKLVRGASLMITNIFMKGKLISIPRNIKRTVFKI